MLVCYIIYFRGSLSYKDKDENFDAWNDFTFRHDNLDNDFWNVFPTCLDTVETYPWVMNTLSVLTLYWIFLTLCPLYCFSPASHFPTSISKGKRKEKMNRIKILKEIKKRKRFVFKKARKKSLVIASLQTGFWIFSNGKMTFD